MVIKTKFIKPTIIEQLIKGLPEFDKKTKGEILKRVGEKDQKYIGCFSGDKQVGFLIAYAEGDEAYYNWIMGVLPDYRRKSCATKMMSLFEEYAQFNGYKKCKVRSINKFRNTLILLINRGYNIVDVENDGKIVFEKLI